MFGELKGTKSSIGRSKRLKRANKKVRMNSLLNLFENETTQDNMQSWNTLKKRESSC